MEMKSLESVPVVLQLNNRVPDFQKFPVMVKASEAEKNYLAKQVILYLRGYLGTLLVARGSGNTVAVSMVFTLDNFALLGVMQDSPWCTILYAFTLRNGISQAMTNTVRV